MPIDFVAPRTKTQETTKVGLEESSPLTVNSCGCANFVLKPSRTTNTAQCVTKYILILVITQRLTAKNGSNVRAVPSGNIPSVRSPRMDLLTYLKNYNWIHLKVGNIYVHFAERERVVPQILQQRNKNAQVLNKEKVWRSIWLL